MSVERIFSGLLLVASLGLLVLAWGYTAPIAYDPIGPRPYPVILLVLLAFFSALLTFRPKKLSEHITMGLTKPVIKNLFICGMAMLLYGVLFEWLGYVIATSLMAFVTGLLFDGKKVPTAIASVVMAVLTYLLFEKALDVSLPAGLLSFLG